MRPRIFRLVYTYLLVPLGFYTCLLVPLGCSEAESSSFPPRELTTGASGQPAGAAGQPSAGAAGNSAVGQGGAGAGSAGTSGKAGVSGVSGTSGQSGGSGEGGTPGGGEAGVGGEVGGGGAGEGGSVGEGGAWGEGGAAGNVGAGGGAGEEGAGGGGAAGEEGMASGGGNTGNTGGAGYGGVVAGGNSEGGGTAGDGGSIGGNGGWSGIYGNSGQGGADGEAGMGGGPAGTRLRIVAANLSSGNFQNYDLGHGIRILQGVKPDIVLIQELSYKSSSAADLQEMTNLVLEGGGFYYREPSSAGYIPNGILSRYPILEAGSWDDPKSTNREFAWARIDVPGDRDLWAISVHLLTKDAATRDAEAKALVSLIKTKIPEEDLVTLGGDINTDVNTEPCFTTFAQQLVVQPPFPADQEGNENTSANRKKPYDWVLADPNLNMLATPVKIGAQVFPAGLVVDTRVYQPLEDLAPAQLGDSAATNMQHMGVVRDFLLPVP